MNTRKILTNTMLYGFGDVIVAAVGGFLLLPLYTRFLTQAEFGMFTAIKANIEILTYVLQFGLISTIGRLYFEYKNKNEHHQYLSSTFLLFLILAFVSGLSVYQFGEMIWSFLSPNIPYFPYIWFSFAIGLFGFGGAFAMIWLRVEEKATMFISIQIASALLLAALVILNLIIFPHGLIGLLSAMLISTACTAAVLPFLFKNKFTFKINGGYTGASLQYGFPIFLGYVAHFITSKISLIILQRYVPLEQMGIFGIAQQLGTVVTVISGAFLKSLQPAIFSAKPESVEAVIDYVGRIYLLIMFFFVSTLILFASEIFKIVAPATYTAGVYIFIIMLVAGFLVAANFIFSSTLLYFKLARITVLITVFGGFLSLVMGLILIPQFEILGAALSILIAYVGITLLNYWLARRRLERANFGYIAMLLFLTLPVILFSVTLHELAINIYLVIFIKTIFTAGISFSIYLYYRRLLLVYKMPGNL